MASMAGVLGSSPAVLEGSLQLGGATRLVSPAAGRVAFHRSGFVVRAQQGSAGSADQAETSRRAVLGLVAAGLATNSFVQAVLAEAKPIPIGPPPPLSGGLPGTDNSDEARDLKLSYKNRFYLQPLGPAEAAARAKESAKEILDVKSLIDKKAWPYVRDDLRSKATYLRFDLKTVILAKPKDQKQSLKELTDKLFQEINKLDYAAKMKSAPEAEKYYASTVSTLNDVLAKLA